MKKFLYLALLLLLSCNRNFKVERVIDGDTIVLQNGERVRYIGIDTPEMKPIEYYAEEATIANRKLVEGKIVRLEFDVERRDIYRRLLAYVFVDTIFVNAWLIKEGYARTYFFSSNLRYKTLFLKLEKEAKDEGRGIWAKELSYLVH